MADWSELPKDLLLLIAKCLETHFDVLHFRSVCPNWRASVPLSLGRRPTFCFPIPELSITDDSSQSEYKSFLFKRTVCLLEFLAEHSQTTLRSLILMLDEDESGKKHVLDPLYKGKLRPTQFQMVLDMSNIHVQALGCEYFLKIGHFLGFFSPFIDRVAYMNANFNDDDGHFFILRDGQDEGSVRLFESEDRKETTLQVEGWGHFVELTQFKRNFYAVDNLGVSICIEPVSRATFPVTKASTMEGEYKFFVESSGNLLLIEAICELDNYWYRPASVLTPPISFEVFHLDEETNRWDRLENLGDGNLILGKYCSFAAPAIIGVEGNCIVFGFLPSSVQDESQILGSRDDEAFAFDLSSGSIVPLEGRSDLLQLFRSTFHM